MSAPFGVDLVPMKRALDNDDVHGLHSYPATLPLRTKNETLRVAGEAFGFVTYEAGGVRYMLAVDQAQRLYRHSNTSALRALLVRYERPLKSLRSVQHDVALSLK